MTRNDFTMRLYNNGRGLTLEQIKDIDHYLIDTIPDGLIEDIEDVTGNHDKAIEQAMEQARDVCIDALAGFTDPLDLMDYLRISCGYDVPDDNIIGLFYALANC